MGKKIIRLFFDIEPYYRLEITDKDIKIYSFSSYSKGKELTQYVNTYGYLRVKIAGKNIFVHDLVAKYCIGVKPFKYTVNHKDGNKLNNLPDNLEYLTIAENIKHAINKGLHVSCNPTRIGSYKDGRCSDIVAYKKSWYNNNRERILKKLRDNYEKKRR